MKVTKREVGFSTIFFILLFSLFFVLLRLRYVSSKPKHIYKRQIFKYPFKSGDLIITSGQRPKNKILDASTIIKIFTGSHYNHTGIVYVDPITKQVYVWEMNGSGTRLATLHDLINGQSRHFLAARSLNKPVDTKKLEQLIRYQWNMFFNWDIALSWYHRFLPIVPLAKGHEWSNGKEKQRTCAHMTAEIYHGLGVVDFEKSGIDPSSIFAADYAKDVIDTKVIPLTNGYAFGPITQLTYPKSHCSSYSLPKRRRKKRTAEKKTKNSRK